MNKVKGLLLATALFACVGNAESMGLLNKDAALSIGKKAWSTFNSGAKVIKNNFPKVHEHIVKLALYGVCGMALAKVASEVALIPLKLVNKYTLCFVSKIPLIGLLLSLPCKAIESILNPCYALCIGLVLYLIATTDPEQIKSIFKKIFSSIGNIAKSPIVWLNNMKNSALGWVFSWFTRSKVEPEVSSKEEKKVVQETTTAQADSVVKTQQNVTDKEDTTNATTEKKDSTEKKETQDQETEGKPDTSEAETKKERKPVTA